MGQMAQLQKDGETQARKGRTGLPSTAPYLLIHVERWGDGSPSGRLTSLYLEKEVPFYGLGDLLLKMDGIYDQLRFPQADREVCFFARPSQGKGAGSVPFPGAFDWSEPPDRRPPEGKKSPLTFLVKTRFRQNGSWQGSITWLEAKEQRNFVSALQCLKLMAEALERTYGLERGRCTAEVSPRP